MYFIVRWGVIKKNEQKRKKEKTITIKKMRVLKGDGHIKRAWS